MPIIQTIATAPLMGGAGGGGGGGGTVAADILFSSDTGSWTGYGTTLGSSNTTATYGSYTYPDTSSGNVYTFTGTEYLYSPNVGNANAWTANLGTITVDLWFYPTAYGIQILSETNIQAMNSYHYTVLEINSSGNVLARFYNGPTATSNNTVTLNQWNHIYWAEDWVGGHYFEVNGINTSPGLTYNRQGPGNTSEYFSIGDYDATNMGNTGRFQGKIGTLNIHDSIVASTYSATRSKYVSLPTAYTLGGANTISGSDWNGSTIVGSYSTWPPGPTYAGTGVIMNNGTYLSMPVTLGYESWTVEIVAEINPTSFWATIFGSETFNTNKGYLAFFPSDNTQISIGSPNGNGSITLTGINAADRAMWAFVNNAGSISVYRNGALVGAVSGESAPTGGAGNNSLFIGARHGNDGTGATDTCNMTLYYGAVYDGALSLSTITANYDAVKTTYNI